MNLKSVGNLVSKWIVLEPLIFLFSLNNMNNVPIQNIYLEKFTEILGNNSQTENSDVIQRHTSDFIRNNADKLGKLLTVFICYFSKLFFLAQCLTEIIRNTTLVFSGLSGVVMLIIGPLTDRYGRKAGILWTVALTGILSNYFLDLLMKSIK